MADAESDVEQYELTEDEDEREEKSTEPPSDTPKRVTGKRKRSLSQNDEEEIARRRRRRRSLAYQQRRRSLTGSSKGGQTSQLAHSKQYISDMYSTIIKMSSENKINVKNSWSLHLIDHMEDILDSSKKIVGEDAEDDDTYNFQKASCTLDASIKIYSYRVDDTWNSSYKILENLSRTEQKHGGDDAGSDAEQDGRASARKTRKSHARTIEKNLNNINLKSYDTECEADPLFHKMSQSFDEGGAKGMLLANLSVYDGCKILLNSSDVSVVTRKPIHAPSRSQEDEDKEKATTEEKADADSAAAAAQKETGNTDSDAQKDSEVVSEDKTEEASEKEGGEKQDEGNGTEQGKTDEEGDKSAEDATMEDAEEGSAKTATEAEGQVETTDKNQSPVDDEEKQTEAMEVDKSDETQTEKEGDSVTESGGTGTPKAAEEKGDQGDKPAAKERISLSLFGSLSCIDQDVQNLSVCPPLYRMYDQLDEYYGDDERHKLGIKTDFLINTPVKGRRKTFDKSDAITMNLAGIMEGASEDESDEEDTVTDTPVDFGDDSVEYDGDEDGTATDEADEAVVDVTDDVEMEKEKETEVIDLAGSDDEDTLEEESVQEGSTNASTGIDKESSLKSSAADFFRAKVNENLPDNYESNLFSQMIESALVRSSTLDEEQGDDQDGRNDYSYFDVKLLRNWAGPGHWKFPAVRKIQMKQRQKEDAERDALTETTLEYDDDGVAIKVEVIDQPKKVSGAGADKKAPVLIDFFGEDPDLSKLKAPKSASSLTISKANLAKQAENAVDLVLPVDTHIELGLFFRHFLKEKPRFFGRYGAGDVNGTKRERVSAIDVDSSDNTDENSSSQPFTYNEDSAGFEGEFDAGYDDEDGATSGADEPSTDGLYSSEGLVQADRVVEKIGVHYERFAKRVDVKKLKGSIWDHLEKETVVKTETKAKADTRENGTEAEKTTESDDVVVLNESGKRPREPEDNQEAEADDDEKGLDTTFENVVENVAGKVPSNVTVSFYFICVLHLANEKGLELVGQDDLRNFQIRKE